MLKDFLGNISNGVKKNQKEVFLATIVFLLILLSFALGYITAKYQNIEPIQFIDKL
ncbi:hypothetical protein KKE19_02795 [Patescibacteria group bacterium]|nr:hypothetical protein [Patescibacteria group bacterium]MBU4367855.1 hypothetical protein [Patescibacteria group bacterium]MBU4461690.1 hypothetical protein [Patescibacteria group bacterium]MCG2700311.1 hypothetical protein [Candidatus Parcubacteria bacterium]